MGGSWLVRSASSGNVPAEAYYSTLCHELTHWTSAEGRCNRQLGKRFGDQPMRWRRSLSRKSEALSFAPMSALPISRTQITRDI
jgi:antirestriction protein ArdC